MALHERQNAILQFLKTNKTANVKTLAKTLYVSEATIRRDLAEMKTLGLIERSHGGAILPENAEEISIFVRMNKNAKEKEQTASIALPHIPEFRSVFIDGSSTALALVQRMDLQFKTVVTNNLQTAIHLSKKENVNLIFLGGHIQFNTNSATGSWTTRQLEEFSFDLMLSSCVGVENGYTFERSLDQKELKRTAMQRSRQKILLVDGSKYNKNATYRLAKLSDYDFVATNTPPPKSLRLDDVRWVY